MAIKHLSDTIINQIAAGEVVERPASVIKELLENAIDAQADRIEINLEKAGKASIRVLDNGIGIPKEELELAISRHCTSKINEDIHDIHSLGFRGEALPSIGSVSKLSLTSRPRNALEGAEIRVEGGLVHAVRPASCNYGTVVEIRDLFFSTPVRLKFMKTDRTELAAIVDVVKRIAMSYPNIYFSLSEGQRKILEYPRVEPSEEADFIRISQILGEEFTNNCMYFQTEQNGVKISGYGSIPSFTRGNSLWQFAYVNNRSIRDKLILQAFRTAYMDVIPRDRYPFVILFLTMPAQDVDVNVHPAKADVRFYDPQFIRSLIVKTIKQGFSQAPLQTATNRSHAMFKAFERNNLESFSQPQKPHSQNWQNRGHTAFSFKPLESEYSKTLECSQQHNFPDFQKEIHSLDGILPPLVQKDCTAIKSTPIKSIAFTERTPILPSRKLPSENQNTLDYPPSGANHTYAQEELNALEEYPLGAARAQFHKNYIIAQTKDSMIIVDQHAAHERLVYESLKEALYNKPMATQILLLPEIINLSEFEAEALLQHQKNLQKFGLVLEGFGPGAVIIRETPALIGEVDLKKLIKDLAHEVMEHETVENLKEKLDHIAATIACHGSIRSGRILKAEEMNALLRQMEALPKAATCNHGRPTYIELKLTDIEKLFNRR